MGEDLRHFAVLLTEVYKWLGKISKEIQDWIEYFTHSIVIYSTNTYCIYNLNEPSDSFSFLANHHV